MIKLTEEQWQKRELGVTRHCTCEAAAMLEFRQKTRGMTTREQMRAYGMSVVFLKDIAKRRYRNEPMEWEPDHPNYGGST